MKAENKVFVRRTFSCDPETLFDWLTRPELITKWFGPEGFSTGQVDCNLIPGGNYRIELRKGDHIRFTVFGQYTEIQRPDRVKFTYDYEGLENPPPPSTVSFTLQALDATRTELSMSQDFEVAAPDFSTRTKAWNFMFDKLKNYL